MDLHDLRERLTQLEGRMNTMDERYDKGWALLREDIAKQETEAVKREKQQLLAIAGLIALATAVLGILIRLLG